MKLKKKCLVCGRTIIKLQNESLKNWLSRHKYCSKNCRYKARIGKPSWNKNKKLHYSVWNKGKKGMQTAWNKGKKLGHLSKKTKEKLSIYHKANPRSYWKDKKQPAEMVKKRTIFVTGQNSYAWKGEKVGYHALHSWIRRKKGKAKFCADCGRADSGVKYEWSNKDHKYRRKLSDYTSRCKKCHDKYDRINHLKRGINYNPCTNIYFAIKKPAIKYTRMKS